MKRTLLILFATTVVAVILISVGLATFVLLASERVNVKLPPNSSFVAICPLQFVGGGLVLAGTCVSGNLTVVEFRAVGDELLVNFTLYDRGGGIYKKGAEWPRFMTPLEKEPEYRELVKRLRVNASIYLVDQGMQGAGGGYTILGSPRMTAALMMEHTALVVDNKTLIVVVTFRAWRMNEEIKGIIADHVEKKSPPLQRVGSQRAFKRRRGGPEVLLQEEISRTTALPALTADFFKVPRDELPRL